MKISYVSWLADEMGKCEEYLDISESVSVDSILSQIEKREEGYKSFFFKKDGIVRISVNGNLVSRDYVVSNNEELVLFAPMSGG